MKKKKKFKKEKSFTIKNGVKEKVSSLVFKPSGLLEPQLCRQTK